MPHLVAWLCSTLLAGNAAGAPGAGQEISAVFLRYYVAVLASPAMEGRLAGSEGGRRAEAFVASRFAALGLTPPPGRSNFAQEFSFTANVSLGEGNRLAFSGATPGLELVVERDFLPASFSADCELSDVPLAFAGFGITSREPARDDYAGLEVRDRAVLVLRDGPDGGDPKSPFAPFTSTRAKAALARERGARALIVVSTGERGDTLPTLRTGAMAGSSPLCVLSMTREAFERTLALEGPPGAAARDLRALGSFGFERLRVDLSIHLRRDTARAANLIGCLPATRVTGETILLGAHWDHLGRGIEGSLAESYGDIHPGADDNASGVAGLLELARVLSRQADRPRRICFSAFGAEELGGLGAAHFTREPPLPLADVVAMINLDMIGRLRERLVVDGSGTAREWPELLARANLKGLSLSLHPDGFGASDHSAFYARGIPVLFFFTGAHADYHRPSDTAERIDYDGEVRVLELVREVVREIGRLPARPTPVALAAPTGAPRIGLPVYVGTIPDFTNQEKGFCILGVRPGSPAERAGLRPGDVLVRLGERTVESIYDYMHALQQYRPGEKAEAVIVRQGTEVRVTIEFGARKVAE
ncbi:MAG: M28 family peptidase [Myxococcales bacterium]|nr:M28 family peptidase [Myxococcales bacterium]